MAGGLANALVRANALGCNVAQLFSKNPRTWKEVQPDPSEARAFKAARKKNGIQTVVSHASYLINIASPDRQKRERSQHALAMELERSGLFGIDFLVLHPGAHLDGSRQQGIELAAHTLSTVLAEAPENAPCLLVETTSGQGTCLGDRFGEIAAVLDQTGYPEKTGVCLDTCHIFAAGYDISGSQGYETVMKEFDALLGFRRLHAIHLNDSGTALGSRKDRHAHIGCGSIGDMGFSMIMNDPRMAGIAKIIETPKTDKDRDMDRVNIDRLLSFLN